MNSDMTNIVSSVAQTALQTVSAVWGLTDVFNGLMAFPNLLALILLSPVVWRVTKDYFERNPTHGRIMV